MWPDEREMTTSFLQGELYLKPSCGLLALGLGRPVYFDFLPGSRMKLEAFPLEASLPGVTRALPSALSGPKGPLSAHTNKMTTEHPGTCRTHLGASGYGGVFSALSDKIGCSLELKDLNTVPQAVAWG